MWDRRHGWGLLCCEKGHGEHGQGPAMPLCWLLAQPLPQRGRPAVLYEERESSREKVIRCSQLKTCCCLLAVLLWKVFNGHAFLTQKSGSVAKTHPTSGYYGTGQRYGAELSYQHRLLGQGATVPKLSSGKDMQKPPMDLNLNRDFAVSFLTPLLTGSCVLCPYALKLFCFQFYVCFM